MIQVDISNVWGQISLPNLLAMEKEVFEAHRRLVDGEGPGSDNRGWMKLPLKENTAETERILTAARRIREESEICVVIGIGGSCLGARAAIELLQGTDRNLGKGKGDPRILFAGNSLSTRQWNGLLAQLEGRDFSVIVISKSGTTTEPAIAFRELRWMLERRYGTDGANRRIYAVTDPIKGALGQMAEEEGWERFATPVGVSGRYSVLSPVGLLPMAVAGLDIRAMLRGAAEAVKELDLRSYENPVWLYAAVRNLLNRHGKAVELLGSFEPGFGSFGRWWQHLFAGSEGKYGKGILPVHLELTEGYHTVGQLVQQGQRNLFETVIRFDPPETPMVIRSDVRNLDGLNYLTDRTMDQVEDMAFQGAVNAHVDGGVPVLCIDCGPLTEKTVGQLFYFLELSCAVSAYILGVNPFNQLGVEPFKRNMFQLLGKPGYGNL